jgi:hypothetical protein
VSTAVRRRESFPGARSPVEGALARQAQRVDDERILAEHAALEAAREAAHARKVEEAKAELFDSGILESYPALRDATAEAVKVALELVRKCQVERAAYEAAWGRAEALDIRPIPTREMPLQVGPLAQELHARVGAA